MRRTSFAALAAALLVGSLFALPGGAEEPSSLSADESERVRHLIDDLGSDDFRVREGAQKALASFGPRALPALRQASKHSSAEVRFRAEQLVRTIEGEPAEKPLGRDGDESRPPPPVRVRRPGGAFGAEIEAELERMRKQLDELRAWMEKGGSAPLPGFDFGVDEPSRAREGVYKSEGAHLVVKKDGVRLAIGEQTKDGLNETKVVEAATVQELRRKVRADPELEGNRAVVEVLRQARHGTLDRRMPGFVFGPDTGHEFGGLLGGGRPGVHSKIVIDGVQIEQGNGKTKVTVTETGPDGKTATKTYEGEDLDAIQREHPELKDRLGFRIEIGRLTEPFVRRPGIPAPPRPPVVPPVPVPPQGELRPDGEMEDEDGEDEAGEREDGEEGADDDAQAVLDPKQAPFGIQIGPVDPVIRKYLGLAENAGAMVRLVRPDSPAAQIGLKVDDIVMQVDGPNGRVDIAAPDALRSALQGAAQGGPLSIEVIRAGRPLKLSR